MKIINTYNDILNLIERMNGVFDLDMWKKYARFISPFLSEKCTSEIEVYDYNEQVLPVIQHAIINKTELSKTNDSFIKSVDKLREKVMDGLGVDLDIDIILYLGLCNGAGWVTKLGERTVILLGIEKIIELNWQSETIMKALIYHEIGHAWHEAVGSLYWKTNNPGEHWLMQLYQEGIATFCGQILTGDLERNQQYDEAWHTWCHANKKEAFADFLRIVDAGESAQDFFGNWVSYKGHSDVGYFLGNELIKTAAMDYSLNELANLDYPVVYGYLQRLGG